MTRYVLAAALALSALAGGTAHADHCEGNAPWPVLDACSRVYGIYCNLIPDDDIFRPCPHIVFA
jgi:hypothetical protein